MSQLKHYGGVLLGVAVSLVAINFILKMVWPSGRSLTGQAG